MIGIFVMRKGDRWYSKEEKQQALVLYRQGLTGKEVEKITGVGCRTVRRMAKKAGLSRAKECVNNLKGYAIKNGKTGKDAANWKGGKCEKGMMSYRLMKRYKITLDDYNEMFSEQQGKCFLCGKSQLQMDYRLCVDHNHKTGKVRGLLCKYCNSHLGWYELNKDKIIDYLEKNDEYI